MMKKTRNITRITVLLLALLVLSTCRKEQEYSGPRKHILVLFDFPLTDQTAIVVQRAFEEEFGDTLHYWLNFRPGVDAPYDRLQFNKYFEDQSGAFVRQFNAMTNRPDLIVLMGDLTAQTGVLCDHPWLREIPVICAHVTYPEWKGRLARRRNFVVLEAKPEPKKNVDFIRQLGRPSWIITGLDSTFLDEKLRQCIMEEMGRDTARYITNLQHESYDHLILPELRDQKRSTFIPINMEHTLGVLADTAYNAHFRIPGILKVWNNHSTFLRLKDDIYIDKSLRHNLGIYFANSPRFFNLPLQSALNVCVGGYMVSWEDMAKAVHPIADELLAGRKASTIPWQVLEKKYWIDWRVARRMFSYADELPGDVHFVNLPWKDKSRFNHLVYTYWKPTLLVVLFLLAVFLPLFLAYRSRKMHRALLDLGHKAERDMKQMGRLLAATRSFSWEMLPGGVVQFSEEFVRDCEISNRRVPIASLLQTITEGAAELEQALNDIHKRRTVVEVVATIPATGHTHAFVCYVNHVRNAQGEQHCLGYVLFNDEANEARRIRQEAYRLAEETSVKESFLAAMSHEIRSPLNSIVGFADILVKQYGELSDEERLAFSHYINESKEQLLRLLDDVMNYSERKGEKFALELSRKSVRELMDEVYYMHTVIVPESLKLFYHCGEDAVVMTNRSAVLQVMSNLMNNAIKFTEQGSITLGWETEEAEDGTWMLLYVKDTGIGISEEHQKHLFEKFYKMDTHSAGAGLGLTLCLQLAESMQGSIRIESTIGKGSRFCLRLKKAESRSVSLGGVKAPSGLFAKGRSWSPTNSDNTR